MTPGLTMYVARDGQVRLLVTADIAEELMQEGWSMKPATPRDLRIMTEHPRSAARATPINGTTTRVTLAADLMSESIDVLVNERATMKERRMMAERMVRFLEKW